MDRASLVQFFGGLAEAGIQIELIFLDFNGYREQDRTANFGFRWSQRSAGGLSTNADGKGAVDCDTGLIMVWSV